MPDPKSGGVMMRYNEQDAKQLVERLRRTIRIKTKEASIKVVIGKESQKDEILAENAETIYNALLNSLTRKKENIKSVLIKFTMSKPVKVKI
jgi:ribosomal protein L1